MELLKPTIIIEDFHGTYAEKYNQTAAELDETSSEPISPQASERALMPFFEMRPWEIIRPISAELGPDNPLTPWKAWLVHLGLSPGEEVKALEQIDAYYRCRYEASYPTTEEEMALPIEVREKRNPYWQSIEDSVERLVLSYNPRECEREGGARLIQQNHKVVGGSGFYADAVGQFKDYLKSRGDWDIFASAPPRKLPPFTLRATLKPGLETSSPQPATNSAESKLFLYTLMRRAAITLGMGLVGIDNDPEIVLGLTERGYTMHTPTPRDVYRRYFQDKYGRGFPDLSDLIDSYGGFESGLGKLAGLNNPNEGITRRTFVLASISFLISSGRENPGITALETPTSAPPSRN